MYLRKVKEASNVTLDIFLGSSVNILHFQAF
jgi:hypothetical protein